jgi:hypothetical protein
MALMVLEFPMRADEELDELGAGRALMCDLKRDLCQSGFTIREGVESWDDYGWSLSVDHQGATIWCMVQASDNWLIQSWPHTSLLDRLRRRDPSGPHREVMDGVLDALSRQRALDGARWLTESEILAYCPPEISS